MVKSRVDIVENNNKGNGMKADNVFYKPCAICGEDNTDFFKIWFDGYVKLYRCKTCGFVSQFPGPGRAKIITDYEDQYSLEFLDKGLEFKYPFRRRAFEEIVCRLNNITEKGRLLDIGCGDGHFLDVCSRNDWDCYGVESSKKLSLYAHKKTGARITRGLYNKEMFPENYFDAIVSIQVLEHVPTPVDFLETAKYHLRPGGIIVIEIPSINAPHFLAYWGTRLKWFVRPPNGIIHSHFGYYSPKTLLTLTDKCKFKKISLITGRWYYKYSGAFRQISRFIDPILNIIRVGGILYIGKKE